MDIKQWINDNLPKNLTMIEAGTCNGSDTCWFSNYFNDGKIYGFEPIPNLYVETMNAIGSAVNVEICQKALSATTGIQKIYVSNRFGCDWGSSSLLKPKDHLIIHTEISFDDEITIETINLDDWFKTKQIDIGLMWLDMQGSEPTVLMNAPVALSRTKYLYTEVSLIETYENVILYPQYKDFLQKNGFEIVFEDLPWLDMGNVLFRNMRKLLKETSNRNRNIR